MTHTLVGLGLAELFAARTMPPAFYGLSAVLSLAPDLDVVAFRFGISYGSRFGHRGFSHSLCCATLLSLLVATFGSPSRRTVVALASFAWVVVVVHSLLDALTDGGMGIAFFGPSMIAVTSSLASDTRVTNRPGCLQPLGPGRPCSVRLCGSGCR